MNSDQIIGTTKSGKAIHADFAHNTDFTADDHMDACKAHMRAYNAIADSYREDGKEGFINDEAALQHKNAADQHSFAATKS